MVVLHQLTLPGKVSCSSIAVIVESKTNKIKGTSIAEDCDEAAS
jgi:hypothetical protein